jgi:hypothetical protein
MEDRECMDHRETRYIVQSRRRTCSVGELIVFTYSIKAKLLALNWTEEDFPDYGDSDLKKWTMLVRQPKELTPRSESRIDNLHGVMTRCLP